MDSKFWLKKINEHLSNCIRILNEIIEFDNVNVKEHSCCFFYMREHGWYSFLVNLENLWELLENHMLKSKKSKNPYTNNLNLLLNKLNNVESQNLEPNEKKWKCDKIMSEIYTYIFGIVKHNIFFYLNLELVLKKHEAKIDEKGYIYVVKNSMHNKIPFLIGGIKYYWRIILEKIKDYFLFGDKKLIDNLYNSKSFKLDEFNLSLFNIDIKNGLNDQFLDNMCKIIFWPEPREWIRNVNEPFVKKCSILKSFLEWLKDKIVNDLTYVENNKFCLFKLFWEEIIEENENNK